MRQLSGLFAPHFMQGTSTNSPAVWVLCAPPSNERCAALLRPSFSELSAVKVRLRKSRVMEAFRARI